MGERRLVSFVTGTRADWSKLRPLVDAVAKSHRVRVHAVGMHWSEWHGETRVEVERDCAAVGAEFTKDHVTDDATWAGPSAFVVHGDRFDALEWATFAAMQGFPVWHVEGGELSGSVDERFRHAVTKLADVHFVANETAARRVMQLGEDPGRVHVIGSPEVDMLRGELPTLAEVAERYGLGDVVGHRSGYGVCVVHPVVGDAAETADVARAALAAAARCDGPFVVIRPNSDDGHEVVAEWIQFHAGPRMRVLPSMRATHFARLLSDAAIAIGNSSAIVREAPVFGTPAISIGTRQRGRVSGGLVYQLPATPAEAVTGAAQALWGQRGPRAMAFGDGRAAERFMAVLEQPATWTRSEKVFHDIESAE